MKAVVSALEYIGSTLENSLFRMGSFAVFLFQSFRWFFARPFRLKLIAEQIEKIGVNSVGIIALSSLAVGMIFALQTVYILRLFQAEVFVGASVALTLTRELAPVMTALMLIAKNGSSMAAEIGTMKVTEQIDAMETMAVNPIHYLVIPRVIACIVVFPLLTIMANVIGVTGAYVVAVHIQEVDSAAFLEKMWYFVDPDDFYSGLIKAGVMGYMVSMISSFYGFDTKNGAKGVGLSTTSAVVVSSVSILMADYVMADIMITLFYHGG